MLGISDSEGPTRRLSWTPPPTLDLTDVHPDISHYNVCLNEVSCRNVEGTELSFLNIRMGIEFSIVAVNVVGQGNASTINHEPCDSTTGELIHIIMYVRKVHALLWTFDECSLTSQCIVPIQVDGDLVMSNVSLQSNGTTPSVTFSFRKVSNTCQNVEVPILKDAMKNCHFSHVQGGGDANCFNLYRIEASPSNQGTPLTQGPVIPTVSGGEDISVSVTSGFVRNTVYNVNIVSVNVNGENFSRGDIQLSKSVSKILLEQVRI